MRKLFIHYKITYIVFSMLVVLFLTSCSNIFLSKSDSSILRVGLDDTYPPMEFVNELNESTGFDVDLAKAIAKKLGRKAVFVSTSFDGLLPGLKTNKFDCIISGFSLTKERKENFAVTTPYLENGQVIVVSPSNNSIKDSKDLEGKKVGVQIQTTADSAAQKLLKTTKFDLIRYDQIIQTFSSLKTTRIDAVIVDELVALDYVLKRPDCYKISGARLTNEPIAICLKKENSILRDKIQVALDELKAESILKTLSIKWFNKDCTSNIGDKSQ